MNSSKSVSVAFEIPINDISSSPKNAKAIKLRLEQTKVTTPTLEQVEMKLKKA
jgi:hypothetical protein